MPAVKRYIDRFEGGLADAGYGGQLYLMGSNGGVLTRQDAEQRPLLLVESGPVGGVAGAAEIGLASGHPDVVAFDMGGTTAKAVLIENREAQVSPIYWVGGYDRGYPAQAAMLDIVEVGYGGGSIAAVSEIGSLQVGPQSAGAVPGPACYGRGGTLPTVTDANVFLGRIDAGNFLGGSMKLDEGRARSALGTLAETLGTPPVDLAAGILKIAVVNMANAVRQVTLQRGMDPRDFAMVAFGGAGPLHAVAVAREIGMETVIVPPQPGHFSAYGMLFADFRHDLTATLVSPLNELDLDVLEREYATLEGEGRARIEGISTPVVSVRQARYAEMRYRRQEYTVKVRLPERFDGDVRDAIADLFEEAYRRRYGHSTRNMEIEIVMLRVVMDGRTARPTLRPPSGHAEPARRAREIWFETTGTIRCVAWWRPDLAVGLELHGPCAIDEEASTTIVEPGDIARIDPVGNIVISLGAAL